MDFQPTTYRIGSLLKMIRTGEIALPDFQREFVWPPSKVVDLLDSVSRGWPIGALLFLQGPQPFQAKALECGPQVGDRPALLILDGQQRVTALYHALTSVSEVVYYINFEDLEAGDDYIHWARKSDFERKYSKVAEQLRDSVVPVPVVYGEESFFERIGPLPYRKRDWYTKLRSRYLKGLKADVYQLIAVRLGKNVDIGALARIFETINRTGVRLNAFDLMVAVLYPHGFKLRDEWEDAESHHPRFEKYSVQGVEILKLIALWERQEAGSDRGTRKVLGVRQSDVLRLSPDFVRKSWPRATKAYAAALEFGEDKLGFSGAKGVPSQAMILSLAFALDSNLPEEKVRSWFWSSAARQDYAHGANTQVVKDVDSMISANWDIRTWSEVDKSNLLEGLQDSIRRNQLLARTVGCLLTVHRVADVSGEAVLGDAEPVSYLPITNFAEGARKMDASKPIASLVFAGRSSLKAAIQEIRKGADCRSILSNDVLENQGFSVEEPEDYASRAENLLELFLKVMVNEV